MPTVNGPVRASDLRSAIKEMGFEPAVVYILELLLDEHTQDRQHLREMASMLDQCIDKVMQMVTVGTSITQQMDQLKRDRQQETRLTTVKGTSHSLTLRNIEPGDELLEAFDYTKWSCHQYVSYVGHHTIPDASTHATARTCVGS